MYTVANSLVCQGFEFSWPKTLGIVHPLTSLSEMAGGQRLNLPEPLNYVELIHGLLIIYILIVYQRNWYIFTFLLSSLSSNPHKR